MIVELDLDKETVFVLEMQIEGDSSSSESAEMRFCIEFDNYILALKAKKVEDGIYEITCPKLKGLTTTGTFNASVEVYIGDKRFVPLSESVNVKQDIKPVVKISESKAASPTISIKSQTKTETVVEPKKPSITKTDTIVKK